MLVRFAALGVWLFGTLQATTVFAWNNVGHKVVAFVAYQEMSNEARVKIVTMLQAHPTFQDDFVKEMPDDIATGDSESKARWLFTQAAIWPDFIKGRHGRRQYDNRSWHYINEPLFVSPQHEEEMVGNLPVNLSRVYTPTLPIESLNVVQAVARCKFVIASSSASSADKAIHICWLIHLVGDIHQPLHSTAIFTPDRFSKGDRGGGEIILTSGKNLHSTWDGLLGKDDSPDEILKRSLTLLGDEKLRKAGQLAGAEGDADKWVEESRILAKKVAYVQAIRDVVLREEDSVEELPKIRLTRDYYRTAGLTARQRVVEAGFRLKSLLGAL